MKKNLYYRLIIGRHNILKILILSTFIHNSSYARLLLEVFIRKNFGERYFNWASALTVFWLLFLIPLISVYTMVMLMGADRYDWHGFFKSYTTWYIFLTIFYYVAKRRRNEMRHNPSVYDFAKFSLHAGDIDPRFSKVKIKGYETNGRLVETFIEPAFFFVISIPLMLLSQRVGFLICVCSIIYSLAYCGTYYMGDYFIMEKIDQMIANEELEKAFVHDADPSETRGFKFYGRRPADKEKRQKLLPLITEDEDIIDAI